MQELGAFFLFTGEVLGQRPMSQHRAALKLLYRESGLEGSIVRPLSARLLPPTIPEKEGRLERERLLGFKSRSRRPHIISTMPMQEDNGEGFTIEMLTHLSHSREERKVPVRQKWQWEKEESSSN